MPPPLLWKPGEPGVPGGSQAHRPLRGTLLPLLRDPAARTRIHLQHLHHPLVTTGTFNEFVQGQLACARGRGDGQAGDGRNGGGGPPLLG